MEGGRRSVHAPCLRGICVAGTFANDAERRLSIFCGASALQTVSSIVGSRAISPLMGCELPAHVDDLTWDNYSS